MADTDLSETLADGDPETVLAAFSAAVDDADSGDAVLRIAGVFALEGDVNVWRVWRENPDLAAELIGVDVDVTDSLVNKYDRLARR